MPQVEVMINGRPYAVQCGSGEEEHTRALARAVDEKVALFAQQSLRAGETRLLVLAALLLADELNEARASLRRMPPDAGPAQDAALGERIDRLARRIEAVASRLDPSHI